LEEFVDQIDGHLAKWLGERDKTIIAPSLSVQSEDFSTKPASKIFEPNFEFWVAEAERNLNGDTPDNETARFCSSNAIAAATDDIEWAHAKNIWGVAQSRLNAIEQSISAFVEISDKFQFSTDSDRRHWCARALVNKGITLGQLGRGADAMALYDEVVARFGAATEEPLRDIVAKALSAKRQLRSRRK